MSLATANPQAQYPPAYLRFVEQFNAEAFWESHETLEGSWRQNGSLFYKALIIYASAFVHAQRGNPIGIQKQLAKAVRYLEAFRPHYLGVDVDGLLAHAAVCRQLAEQAAQSADPQSAARHIPRIRIALQPMWVHGTEAELAAR